MATTLCDVRSAHIGHLADLGPPRRDLGARPVRVDSRSVVTAQEVVFPAGAVRLHDVDGDGTAELQITNPSGGPLPSHGSRSARTTPASGCGPPGAAGLADELHAALADVRGVLASASAVEDDLVVARVVARDAVVLYRALEAVRGPARRALGLPPSRRPVS